MADASNAPEIHLAGSVLTTGGQPDRLLKRAEVAALFRVDPATVTRWGASGRLRRARTGGGRALYYESAVLKLLRDEYGTLDGLPIDPAAGVTGDWSSGSGPAR